MTLITACGEQKEYQLMLNLAFVQLLNITLRFVVLLVTVKLGLNRIIASARKDRDEKENILGILNRFV